MQSCAKVYNDSPCAVLGLQGPVTSSRLNKVDRACGMLWVASNICGNAPCFKCSYFDIVCLGCPSWNIKPTAFHYHYITSTAFSLNHDLFKIPQTIQQHIQHLGAQAFRELSKCTHPDRLRGRLERPPSKEEALGSWEADPCLRICFCWNMLE